MTLTEAQLDDLDLVRAAQADIARFAALYRRYRDRVLAYCWRRLGDPAEAEDAASAIFVKALGALPAFRDREGSFRSWLFRIAHNEVADRHKRWARRPESSLSAEGELVDPGRTPEELALLDDEAARLRCLLEHLSDRERAVLDLRLAGLTTAEIARALGIATQTVRTAQSRAVARLRPLLIEADLTATKEDR